MLHETVENSLRKPWSRHPISETATVVSGLSVFSLGVLLLAAHIWAQEGWEWRVPEEIKTRIAKMSWAKTDYQCKPVKVAWSNTVCSFGDESKQPSVLVIGDSHANRLGHGIYTVTRSADTLSGLVVVKRGAVPLRESVTYANGSPSKHNFTKEIDYATGWDGELVILHGFFEYYWWGTTSYPGYPVRLVGRADRPADDLAESQMLFEKYLVGTFETLSKARSKVIVVGSIPNSGINIKQCMQRPMFFSNFENMLSRCSAFSKDQAVARASAVNRVIKHEAERAGLTCSSCDLI